MLDGERVLLDTSALYALISATDDFHEKATTTYRDLLSRNAELWVSSYVLVEFGALVHHRLGFSALKTFADSTSGVLETFWIDRTVHAEAWRQFETRNGMGLNFVDWTVLIASRRLGARVFTFDGGFPLENVPVVP